MKVNTKLILDAVYPVGSIYMSVNSTSPATLFGGTWEKIKDRFLLGAGDTYSNGATGGEATHTLTTDEMPSHAHQQTYNDQSYGTGWYMISAVGTTGKPQENEVITSTITTSNGGDQPHNNMPPYLAVYMWKRTA